MYVDSSERLTVLLGKLKNGQLPSHELAFSITRVTTVLRQMTLKHNFAGIIWISLLVVAEIN